MTYLILPHIKVLNANALSSTYTIGFPAMPAWMGFVHALQRQINREERWKNIIFTKTGVCCYRCDLQVYKGPGDYRCSIITVGKPLKKKGNTVDKAPFIEEPRIHLEVSLLIQCEGIPADDQCLLKERIKGVLPRLKMAGGDIVPHRIKKENKKEEVTYCEPDFFDIAEDEPESEKKELFKFMPGYFLVERRDLLEEKVLDCDGLEHLLSYVSLEHKMEKADTGRVWRVQRKAPGWIIPISVGFKGISKLGKVKNQRDPNVMHCFVENLVTLGEFKMPYHFNRIEDIMWYYEYDKANQLYVCKNEK